MSVLMASNQSLDQSGSDIEARKQRHRFVVSSPGSPRKDRE